MRREPCVSRWFVRLLSVHSESHFGGGAGFGDPGIYFDFVLTCREFILCPGNIALDDHHVVFLDELALVHVKVSRRRRRPAHRAHRGVVTELGVDRYVIAFAAQSRCGELWHARRRGVELPLGVGVFMRSSGWRRSQMPAPIGKTLFFFASLRKAVSYPPGVLALLPQNYLLEKNRLQVVELPDVLARIPGGKPRACRKPGVSGPKVQAYQPL